MFIANPYRFNPAPLSIAIEPPNVWYETAFALDITTNTPLYELNPDLERPIYSISKVLSALVVLDHVSGASLSNTVTINADDIATIPVIINLAVGDVVTYSELLKGMVSAEGSDATRALARSVGDIIAANEGNIGNDGMVRFVEAMNEKAISLGCSSFTMTNPGGSNLGENTASARDVAKMFSVAVNNTTLQPLMLLESGNVVVSGGPSPRSLPFTDPLAYTGRANVLAHHVGFYQIGGDSIGLGASFIEQTYAMAWQAPNGNKIVFIGLNNNSLRPYGVLAIDAMRRQIPKDFTYLDPTNTIGDGTDANFSNVVLLVGGDTDPITDESSSAKTVTNNNVTRTTSNRLIGSHTMLFNGTTSYLEVPTSTDFQFGTGNFCVEVLFRWDNNLAKPIQEKTLVGVWDDTLGQYSWLLNFRGVSGLNIFQGLWYTGSSFYNVTISPTPQIFGRGTHHLAWVRNGSTTTLYLNGQGTNAAMSGPSNNVNSSSAPLRIGAFRTSGGVITQNFPGTIDEVRITKGVSRYSGTTLWALDSESNQIRKHPRSS